MAKKPKQKFLPSSGRLPAVQPPSESTNHKKISFNLEYLDSDFGLDQCSSDDHRKLLDAFCKRSGLTWNEINTNHRHKLGYEKIPIQQIKAPKPKHLESDAVLLVFRFSGKKPMVGYREEAVFYVIWLDHNYTLYDHG